MLHSFVNLLGAAAQFCIRHLMGTSGLAVLGLIVASADNKIRRGWSWLSWRSSLATLAWWALMFSSAVIYVVYEDHVHDRSRIQALKANVQELTADNERLSKIKPASGPMAWPAAIEIVHAFQMIPKPCRVEVHALSNQSVNDARIFMGIIYQTHACDVVDVVANSNAAWLNNQDIDAPNENDKVKGLRVHWNEKKVHAQAGIDYLAGCCVYLEEGHRLPAGIPPDIIYIEFGRDPWKLQ